jgi:predicted phage-related endonuclease
MSTLIQGSDEWHDFRRKHIGASDSPAIMELDPFCSLLDKWEEKVGLRGNKELNDNITDTDSSTEEKVKTKPKKSTKSKTIVV